VKAARPVLNGGREETGRKVTRLAPTQHHYTGKVLAYVFGRRQDDVFLKLQQLLDPFGMTRSFTDGWGAYERHLEAEQHMIGKAHTQKIESKHMNLRTRIKLLVRRTICFSKTEHMHDLVIGLFLNRYEFGVAV
jgi:insertion element IS1 protein InsB